MARGTTQTNSTEDIKRLQGQLRAGEFAPVYLVMGEQDYLRTSSRDMIRNALVPADDTMNCATFTGDRFTVQEIIDLAETLPFFADRRLIIIENSGMFNKQAAKGEPLVDYLANIPETTHILFVEQDVDRTRRLYKAVHKSGTVLDCATPQPDTVRTWIRNKAREAGMQITDPATNLLMQYNESNLLLIKNDIDKLAAYCMGRPGITEADVRTMCTRQIGDWIFDLIAAISACKTDRALQIYMDLLQTKTAPQQILALMIRNYNQLLQVSELAERGYSANEIADITHIKIWVVRNRILDTAKSRPSNAFAKALNLCVQTDQDYKAGRISDQLAVEQLIITCASGT